MNNMQKEKNWPIVLAEIIDFLLIVIYFIIGFHNMIDAAKNFDFAGMFDSVVGAIWFITIASIVLALICLCIKPMRTKATIRLAIFNLVWAGWNIYCLCG